MNVGTRIRVVAGHAMVGQAGTVRKIVQEGSAAVHLVEMAEDGADWRCTKPQWLVEDLAPEDALSAPALVEWLAGIGITLTVSGESLRYDAPKGAMTVDLAARLKAAKPDLVRRLGPEHAVLCFTCGGEIEDGGSLYVEGPPPYSGPRFYHFRRPECLPADRRFNSDTGMIERIQS